MMVGRKPSVQPPPLFWRCGAIEEVAIGVGRAKLLKQVRPVHCPAGQKMHVGPRVAENGEVDHAGVKSLESRRKLRRLLLDVRDDPRSLQDHAGIGGDKLPPDAAEQQRGIVLPRRDLRLPWGRPSA